MGADSGGAHRVLWRLWLVALSATLGALLATGVATAAPPKALINEDTVVTMPSPSMEEQVAVAQGFAVTVVSGATWAAMTPAEFGAYDLLIIGDAYCASGTGNPQTAAANAATWAPVVMGTAGGRTMPGNRIVIGTDPVFHSYPDIFSERATIIREGIAFAGALPGRTGIYFCASCFGGNGNVLTALGLLSAGSGTWTDNSSPPCGVSASVIAAEPSFPTLTSASLQGWGCSVHESWPTFASDWSALAVGTDTPTMPTCGIDPSTGLNACGEAYILIAGSGIVVASDSIAVAPLDATNPIGTSHTITATVTSGGSPLVGQLVTFTVTGQNAGAVGVCSPADCKSDASGNVTFTYADTNGSGDDTIKASFTDAGGSLQAATAQKHWAGCTCMDIAFVIDDAASMAGAIANLQGGFNSIIAQAMAASGGDLRMSVVSFKDAVDVDQGMTTVVADVQAAMAALVAGGGSSEPEASDQGLRVAVTDASTCGPTGAHGAFRPECVKIAIVATDAPPGGCDDNYAPGVDDVEANAVANLALAGGIKLSAIQVLNGSNDAIEAPIMMNYATVTGGTFVTTPSDGSGAPAAINAIIAECGGAAVVCGDNVVGAPGEECDGTQDAACPGGCLPPGDPNACTCIGPSPTPTPTPTASATPVLDHFQCYETHRGAFNLPDVSLVDQFGASTVTVKRNKRVCAPADKNGEDPTAPAHPGHLTFYTIKQTAPHFTKVRDVTVTNQFGTFVFDVTKPDRLLVPTAKSLTGTPPPLAFPMNHFKCYRVAGVKFRASGLQIEDQFGSLTVDIKKPTHLCVAADKNGGGVADPMSHLTCYQDRVASGAHPQPAQIFTNNQFGTDAYPIFGPRDFCVPSTIP